MSKGLQIRPKILAMATTWSASVACRIPRKKPKNRKDTTFRAVPVIAHAPSLLSPAILCSISTQRQFPYAHAPRGTAAETDQSAAHRRTDNNGHLARMSGGNSLRHDNRPSAC
jgi:hypothetical protein